MVKNSGITVLDASIKMAFRLFEARHREARREARFSDLFRHMINGAALHELVCDGAGKVVDYIILDVNEAFVALLDIPRHQAIGRKATEVYGVPEAPYLDGYAEVVRTGEHREFETYFPAMDKHFAISAYRFSPGRFATIFEDISVRKRSESTLRKSEALYRAIVETSNDGITLVDRRATVMYRSPSYRKIDGYTQEERLGQSGFDTVHPDDVGTLKGYWAEIAGSPGLSLRKEFRIRHKDGLWRWIETTAQNHLDDPELNAVVMASRDVTERIEAERALFESDKFIEQIMNSADEGIVVYGPDLRYKVWNPFMERISGRAAAEVLGRHPAEIFPFLAEAGIIESLEGILAGAQGWKQREFPYELPGEGRSGWTSDSSLPLLDAGGKTIGVIGIVHDITHYRRMIDELNAKESRLRLALEAARAGTWEWDLRTGSQVWSDELWQLYGLERNDAVPSYDSFMGSVAVEDRGRIADEIDRAVRDGSKINLEWRVASPSGRRWLMSRSMPETDAAGRVERYLGIVIDVTERKKAEEALRTSEELFRAIAMNSPDHIVVQDRDLRYTYVINPQLGLSEEDMIGKTDFDFLSPEEAELLTRVKTVVMTADEPSHFRTTLVSREGKPEVFDGTYIPRHGANGDVDGLVGYFRNITEQARSDEEIEKLLAEKELLLREIHHRIRNNMNAICGFLELQAAALADAVARTALETVIARMRSMMVLYNRLYESASFDSASVADYIPSLVDEILSNFPTRMSLRVEKKIDDFVLDAKRLQPLGIIVNELLTNIMKHAFAGRTEGNIVVSAELQGSKVILAIEDDGNGLPESVGFENSPGFGLMIVGALTTQLGGSIRIDRRGEAIGGKALGTRVVLQFPATRDPRPGIESA
ncbi:MAG: PAS domain S-box protein [Spirochaetota bacterium]